MNNDDLGCGSRDTSPLREATFAITTDTGTFEWKSKLLCKSIRKRYPTSRVINFIPESSLADLSDESRRFFHENTTIVTGDLPIPGYDISAKLRSFCTAAERADGGHLVMLDTDTVLLSPLTLPSDGADLYAKPVDIGAQHWGCSESLDEWKRLYERFDVPFPTTRVQSTVDKRIILPYWNAGVVITTDDTVPRRLLDMTETILDEDLIDVDETFFFDQLALAILSETLSVTPLWESQNYPVNARLACPTETQLLHYRDRSHLVRVPNPGIRRELRSLGVDTGDIGEVNVKRTLVRLVYAHSGKYLSRERKEKLGEYLSRCISSESQHT